MKKLKLIIPLLMALILFVFPQRVYAHADTEYAFADLFLTSEFVPAGVRVLNTLNAGDRLILNLSQEALNYGGTYFEYRFIQELLNIAGGLGFERLVLLIEGRPAKLPEGTIL